MATVTVRYIGDPLRLTEVETRAASGAFVREAVARAFPELDPSALVFVRGAHEVNGDAPLRDGETILCAVRPAGADPITWAMVVQWVVTALVSAAVSYLIGYLTRPKQRNKTASPAYSVNIEQNAARIGGTIPVIYGRVTALPDIAAQAYSEFIEHNERVSMILCLGMGEFNVNDIFVGDTRAVDYPTGAVQTWIFGPAAHAQTLGNIEAATGVCEDMMTVLESVGVDLAAPNDPTELSIAASVSGGVLTPNDATAPNLWLGLVPGQKYIVSNNTGVPGVVVTYVGIGPNNTAQFDGPLPAPPAPQTVNLSGRLIAVTDAKEGEIMRLELSAPVPQTILDGLITIQPGSGAVRGPFDPYRASGVGYGGGLVRTGPLSQPKAIDPDNDGGGTLPSGGGAFHAGPPVVYLRKSGPGFTSANNTPIDPATAITVRTQPVVVYYITPYNTDTPTYADPYRWRGWYAVCKPGQTVNAIWFDVEMPGGIAWVTDKGDYNPIQINWRVEIQPIDDNSNPTGAVFAHQPGIAGATNNPRRQTFGFAVAPGRYRVRVARMNMRDQRSSKEISGSRMAGLRARIVHAPGTPAYENCTLLVMKFTATAGLAAASGRRIKVDCTRRLPSVETGALIATSNPAEAFADIYENTSYGPGRPRAELDAAKLLQLRPQWATVNGFNGVFDQPSTVVEGLQAVLGPVNAIPLPMGAFMSVAQDAPRAREYVFSPGSYVNGSLSIGYNFDGADEPDHLEVIFTDPATMADARVYYPSKGVRAQVVECFGCTSQTHALNWAKLRWQERTENRKTVEMELEGEGYLIQPLTRFALALPNVAWGNGGVVLRYDAATRELLLDQPFPLALTQIQFVSEVTGKVGAAVAVASRVDEFTIILASDPSEAPHAGNAYGDGTRWVASSEMQTFFEFSVTNLEAAGPMRVKVTGQQYTAAKYAGTFVETWVT